jgi:hypothetical protein
MDINTTVDQAKEQLLIPLFDKLLSHEDVLATLFFINRLSDELISLEIFLFCSEEIEHSELNKLIPCASRHGKLLIRPLIQQYDYW